jgi:hypothetical protein
MTTTTHRPRSPVGEKIAAKHRGRVHASLRGRSLTEEHRAKVSASKRGAIPKHGTRARYKGSLRRDPCRCPRCRRAWRDYKQSLRRVTA